MKIVLLIGVLVISACTWRFAQADPSDLGDLLKDLENLQKEGEKFQTEEFRLLWAREAWRCGNDKGAMSVWEALAAEGSRPASYILSIFDEWLTLAEDGSETATYALRLFRPGDGTGEGCK